MARSIPISLPPPYIYIPIPPLPLIPTCPQNPRTYTLHRIINPLLAKEEKRSHTFHPSTSEQLFPHLFLVPLPRIKLSPNT
ncbi:unnamed protein product [Periconia digitata]|uniref:Uncharacterized protein n=1 Tax=Periconia digitata TaxID=1303443 RepID=A0A9W4XYM1_9PLEO|nr:unnamed protein product [Periconia digitata]